MKIRSAQFITSAFSPGGFPRPEGPEIAFAGRSNVGKSSLINALLNKKGLAKTSQTPGKTRAVNFFLINESFVFADLPGFGYAKVPEAVRADWKRLVESYLQKRPTLKVVALLVDSRRGLRDEERQLLDYLASYHIPVEIALTKADKLKTAERHRLTGDMKRELGDGGPRFTFVSSLKNTGLKEFWGRLREALDQRETSPTP